MNGAAAGAAAVALGAAAAPAAGVTAAVPVAAASEVGAVAVAGTAGVDPLHAASRVAKSVTIRAKRRPGMAILLLAFMNSDYYSCSRPRPLRQPELRPPTGPPGAQRLMGQLRLPAAVGIHD